MSVYLAVHFGAGVGKVFRLNDSKTFLLGRGDEADVSFQDMSVSRRHCELWIERRQIWLRDLYSRHGVRVNDSERLAPGEGPVELMVGDRLQLGSVRLTLQNASPLTRGEWLSCAEVNRLLNHLPGRGNSRKLRLFACACCRRIWQHLIDTRSRQAVVMAERYADGLIGLHELEQARREAQAVLAEVRGGDWEAADAAVQATEMPVQEAANRSRRAAAGFGPPWQTCCDLARDLLGEFFYPVIVSPEWLRWQDGAVPKMAQAIYDDYSFADLPILADALEDAGCQDERLLRHCRDHVEHARGCWVLDALLGRTNTTELLSTT